MILPKLFCGGWKSEKEGENCLFLLSILLKEVTVHLAALESFLHLCPLSLCLNSFLLNLVSTCSLPAFRYFLTQYTKLPFRPCRRNSKNLPQHHIHCSRNLFPPSRIPNTKELATCVENAISSKCEPSEEAHFGIGRLRPQ
jgi:hypothetical protein